MAIVVDKPRNGGGYEVSLRNDLPTSACVICQHSFDGAGIDFSPVDVLCMICANAVSVIMGNPSLDFSPAPKRFEDLFPDDGTPPLHDNDPAPVEEPHPEEPALTPEVIEKAAMATMAEGARPDVSYEPAVQKVTLETRKRK